MISLRFSLLFLLSSASLVAQPGGDEDDLYFPALLSILVSPMEAINRRPEAVLAPSREEASTVIMIETYTEEEYAPLLPILFFDQGSSVLPHRYLRLDSRGIFDFTERTDVHIHDMYDAEIAPSKYYDILNIVGERMTQFPATTISVQGMYSGEPGEDERIGRERGEVVKEYLTTIWRIAPERIVLLSPEGRATENANIFQRQEVRRVTISSESWEIHRPLFYRTVTQSSEFAILHISLDPRMRSEEIADATLSTSAGDTLLATGTLLMEKGSGSQRWTLLWSIPRPHGRTSRTLAPFPRNVTFHVTLRTIDGRVVKSNDVIVPIRIDSMPLTNQEWLTRRERKAGRRLTEVPFFESGDTALSPLQLMMIERTAAGFSMTTGERSKGLALMVRSYGSQEEHPEIDPAVMEIVARSPFIHRCLECELTTVRMPNGFLPMTPQMVYDMGDVEDTLERQIDSVIRGIDDAMIRSLMDDESELMKRLDEDKSNYSETATAQLDTLQMRRNEAVYSGFLSGSDPSMFIAMTMHTVHIENMPLHLLPEQRMYRRSVDMWLFDPVTDPDANAWYMDLDEPEIEEEWDEPDDEAEEE